MRRSPRVRLGPLISAAAVLAGLLWQPSPAQEGQEAIGTLIEKARRRETLFDGFDVRFAYDMTFPTVKTSTTGRCVKHGNSFLLESEGRHVIDGQETTALSKAASDGLEARSMQQAAEGASGQTYPHSDAVYGQAAAWSPQALSAVTHVHQHRISQLLDEKAGLVPAPFKDGSIEPSPRTVTVLPAQSVNGRNCIVVEVVQSPASRQSEIVYRMYFAADLDYACVKVERGELDAGDLRIKQTWTMDDFREVGGGLFVAFSSRCESRDKQGQPVVLVEHRIDEIEFPETFDAGAFTFEFPPGADIRDRYHHDAVDPDAELAESIGQFILEAAEEALEDPEEEAGAARPQPAAPEPSAAASQAEGPPSETPVPPEQIKGRNLVPIISILAAAALLAIAAVVLWRKRCG